jgi:hypothetical protein
MATSDQEQQSILVPQHKRMAQGAKLDGTSMQAKGAGKGNSKPAGGLSHVKKKK